MSRILYSWLLWCLQPLLRFKLLRRALAEPVYTHAVSERFGSYTQAPDQGRVWIHAVSLGETRAAAVLLAALREQQPQLRLLLTHGTATGRQEGAALLRAGDVQVWQPWDTPSAVRRFLLHFRPRVGILIETEVWPNLSAQCAQQQVPLVLVNARMSADSARRARRLAWLSRPAYGSLAAAWAQTDADAQRLRELGAEVRGVTGNIKYDAAPDAAQLAQARRWRGGRRPVVMLASSREGEEQLWLDALQQFPGARQWQWLVVPRHPQRFDAVALRLQQAGLGVARRSAWDAAGPPADADVWLGDSLGEMSLYYGLADVALLGGSFAPLGGQNLIEALQAGCPVLMGPHTFNFAQPAEAALQHGAALRVSDMAQALVRVGELFADAPRLAQLRQQALAFGAEHQGAARRTARALSPWLG